MMRNLLFALMISVPMTASYAQNSPPAEGMVLWLKADEGIFADASGVWNWYDQSGNGNDAWPLSADYGGTGMDLPALVEDAVKGLPAVRFDGEDDVLEIMNSPTMQPGGGSWTVLFVARRLGPGQGDFPQIIGSRPWLAGLDKGWAVVLDEEGHLASHFADDLTGHDAPQVKSAAPLGDAFEIWQVEENRGAGQTVFYRRGDADQVLSTQMPEVFIDQFNPVHIGREIGGANNRRANVEIAEILIYNRVLPEEERIEVTSYLAERYALPFTVNQPPSVTLTSPENGTSVEMPGTVVLSASAEDPDGSIDRIEFYNGEALIAAATQPPYSATLRPLATGTMSITAVAVDDRGGRTASAPAEVTVTGSGSGMTVKGGLRLWLRADAGLSVENFSMRWEDQSGNGNDAVQADSFMQPEIVAAAVNGQPALRFDGVDDYLQILNDPSLQPADGDWSVFFVARRGAASQGDFPQVIGSRPWVAGLDEGWAVSFDSGGVVASHYADGAAGHDVPDTRAFGRLSDEAFQAWGIEENRAAGQTAFYLNGALDRSSTRPMPVSPIEQVEDIYIGREIGGADNRRANMDLAEVLVFSRILSPDERDAVMAYLAGKYGMQASAIENEAPEVVVSAPAGGSVFEAGDEITISASAEDDGSIAGVEILAGTRVLGAFTSEPYTVSVMDLPAGRIVLTARATDNLGLAGVSEAVVITNQVVNAPKPLDLIGVVDYSDTFTVGPAGEPTAENPRPDGMHNNDAFGGYMVESSHGNPEAAWTPAANFSFNTPGNSTGPAITQAAAGNEGAAGGFAQSGSGDFSIAYGLRSDYVVEVDAIAPLDRLDIGSYAAAGDPISAAGSLTVFFRKDSSGEQGVALYNGSEETAVTNAGGQPVRTGIDDQNWHRFSVHFNQAGQRLGIYVDGALKADVDLATFAGGAYANFENGAVGIGGEGFDGTQAQWFDNFAAGAPSLVGVADYSDTFTVTEPRSDGLYNDNSAGAYEVEETHGNPPAVWTPTANFSFNTPGSSTGPAITEAALGNPGAAGGIAQSGGGDFSIPYALRENYVVAADAILPLDRLDIGSYSAAGAGIGDGESLTVFFRRDSAAVEAPGIGLYDGSAETAVTELSGTPLLTGIDDLDWHRFAVHFDRPGNALGIYIDGQLRARVDLATFADGAYSGYSNAAVGIGGDGFDGTHAQWFDNFEVGLPGPAVGIVAQDGAVAGLGPLAIQWSGDEIQITWPGEGTLEEAGAVQGPYEPVPDAASGYIVAPSEASKFYRLKQ